MSIEELEAWTQGDGRDMGKLREALFGDKMPPAPETNSGE